jgi:hypothetical protein
VKTEFDGKFLCWVVVGGGGGNTIKEEVGGGGGGGVTRVISLTLSNLFVLALRVPNILYAMKFRVVKTAPRILKHVK